MSLNVSKAISYNENREYDTRTTAIIQARVGGHTHGTFDQPTVEKIYEWQGRSYRFVPLVKDGKMGPNTLGIMIAEMRRAHKYADASVLARYDHNLPSGAETDPDGSVGTLRRIPKAGLDLRRPDSGDWADGWIMRGVFDVKIELDSGVVDPTRYEYRQLIKGNSYIQEGWFRDNAQTVWEALEPAQKVNHIFKIPGGLTNSWKEDGYQSGSIVRRFGRRSAAPVHKPNGNAGEIDRYLPHQNGYNYEMRDTFGVRNKNPAVIGTKVHVELYFMGCIMDKHLMKYVKTDSWSYKKTAFLKE